jgi:hypothetical protein
MRSFARRSQENELMDAPGVTAQDLADCLTDLVRVNAVTRARAPTLQWIARATGHLDRGQSFTLLDVGFGQGDMLRAVHGWALRAKLRPVLSGVDLSPWSAPAARLATAPSIPINYRVGDVFAYEPDAPVDYVISSLVAHHMSDEQLIRFIKWMEKTAQGGWFINDLHRHALAYYGFKVLSCVAGWHRFVRHDGPVSVARAFLREDWLHLLAAAEIPEEAVTIKWCFPFRICVGRIK